MIIPVVPKRQFLANFAIIHYCAHSFLSHSQLIVSQLIVYQNTFLHVLPYCICSLSSMTVNHLSDHQSRVAVGSMTHT